MGLFLAFFKSFPTSRCLSHKCVNSQRSSSSSVIRVSSWNHPGETTSPYPAMIVKIETLRQTQCMLVFVTDLVIMCSLRRLAWATGELFAIFHNLVWLPFQRYMSCINKRRNYARSSSGKKWSSAKRGAAPATCSGERQGEGGAEKEAGRVEDDERGQEENVVFEPYRQVLYMR